MLRISIIRAGVVAGLMAGVLAIGAPSSSALGYNAWLCGQDNQWAGQSTTDQASTLEIGDCGSMKVRAQYYANFEYYWTTWSQHASYAVANPISPVYKGQHAVTSCGWIYDCGPHYT